MYTELTSGWEFLLGGKASTPWGEAVIAAEAGFLTVILGDRVVATIVTHPLHYDFSFPGKTVMSFKNRPGRSFLTYTGDTGSVTIPQVKGKDTVPEMQANASLTNNKLERLTKGKGSKSTMSNRYRQWTIRVSGILPVEENDVVFSLIMLISLFCLQEEMPHRGGPAIRG